MGRQASGVTGMRFKDDTDYIVGMAIISDDTAEILVVTEKGYGKRTDSSLYRLQTRGGTGVKALNVTEKNGKLVTLKAVNDKLDLIITTNKGMTIRMHVKDISVTGRAAQGVKLITLKEEQNISNIALIPANEEEDLA